MSNATVPLAIPEELLTEVRSAARKTGLSQQDVMRKSIRFGLPKLVEKLAGEEKPKAFTKEESRLAFGPDPEWDALAAAMCKIPPPPPEE